MCILSDVWEGWIKKHWVSFRERAINLGYSGESHGKASKTKWHLGWFLKDRTIAFFLIRQTFRPVSKTNDWAQKLLTFRKLHCYGYKNSPSLSCQGKITHIGLQNGLVSSPPVIGLPTSLSCHLNPFLNPWIPESPHRHKSGLTVHFGIYI